MNNFRNGRLCLLFSAMLAIVCGTVTVADTPRSAAQIRQELREIRRSTDWSDSRSTQQANERIGVLKNELEQLRVQRLAGQDAISDQSPSEPVKPPAANMAAIWEQVEKTAAQGEGAVLDLAAPLREKIVETYVELYNPEIKNPVFFNEINVLVIDFSQPEAEVRVRQLDQYRAIETLVLTGGKHGAPIQLASVLQKARALPLKELYVVYFRNFLNALPDRIGDFDGLTKLGLYGNNLSTLPPALTRLTHLKTLHVDLNPLTTLLPAIRNLSGLEELGIGQTRISSAEIETLRQMIPNCRISTQ